MPTCSLSAWSGARSKTIAKTFRMIRVSCTLLPFELSTNSALVSAVLGDEDDEDENGQDPASTRLAPACRPRASSGRLVASMICTSLSATKCPRQSPTIASPPRQRSTRSLPAGGESGGGEEEGGEDRDEEEVGAAAHSAAAAAAGAGPSG